MSEGCYLLSDVKIFTVGEEKRAALTSKVGILVKKPKYVGREQERGAIF